jgi:hypothetical protein
VLHPPYTDTSSRTPRCPILFSRIVGGQRILHKCAVGAEWARHHRPAFAGRAKQPSSPALKHATAGLFGNSLYSFDQSIVSRDHDYDPTFPPR